MQIIAREHDYLHQYVREEKVNQWKMRDKEEHYSSVKLFKKEEYITVNICAFTDGPLIYM